MSYLETIPFDKGLNELSMELASGSKAEKLPASLYLKEIRMAHSVFQPREFSDLASSENHIENLVKAIEGEASHKLDPVVIWWSGKHWRIIDGHHRILAYKRYFDRKKIDEPIPVSVFEGSLIEAIIESTRANSKDKLSMSQDDKLNRAWKLTVVGSSLSKAIISKSCKIGSATVGRMRKKLVELKSTLGNDWQSECLSMSWKDAMTFGQQMRVIDENWESKIAKEWSRRLAKAFGKKLAAQPTIAGKAIQLYSEQLAQDLAVSFSYLITEEHKNFIDDF